MDRLIEHLKTELAYKEQESRQTKAGSYKASDKTELQIQERKGEGTEAVGISLPRAKQPQLAKGSLGVEMVVIARGAFIYGDNKETRTSETDYLIDVSPVTNEAFKLFVEAGGYLEYEYWSEQGWQWKESNGIISPLYCPDSIAQQLHFPIVGVSYFESEAYASVASLKYVHKVVEPYPGWNRP